MRSRTYLAHHMRKAGMGRAHMVLRSLAATLVALLIVAAAESALGRVFICTCGYVKLWHGDIWSSENSQHLTDWYTFTHVLHGFGLFYLGRILKRASLFQMLVFALAFESAWEIIENSSFIIERYRATTISLDYTGDSIVNSLADVLAMVIGFALAARLSVRAIVLLTALMELGLLYFIRDNLTLNIVTLLVDLPALKQWQMGQ